MSVDAAGAGRSLTHLEEQEGLLLFCASGGGDPHDGNRYRPFFSATINKEPLIISSRIFPFLWDFNFCP